ncbi:hypothetical protein Y032_0019g3929 [Ancylostoma ceylanicum]|uniref:Reverse transcriptase domain-containing protein n=1 Tax=Ancylostoma ceylanicum TaxID=53326 RepID=A0A016V3P6_9BILA|nr:hypothetical protein Y032_0019g3929 [Ancylostoma ceylanicum]
MKKNKGKTNVSDAQFTRDSKLDVEVVPDMGGGDLEAHLSTLMSFFEKTNNIPRDVVDAFSAIQRIVKASMKSNEDSRHERSIVIHGIPELPEASLPSQRQLDTERKVTEILDVIGVEARPCAVVRLGNLTSGKTRLVKVIFPCRSQYFMALSKARILRDNPKFRHIFLRTSLTPSERKRQFDLRAEARQKNQIADRNSKRGGGVCVFIKHGLTCDETVINYKGSADVLCFSISEPSLSSEYRAVLVYRPPCCTKHDDDKILELLYDLCGNNPNILLLGDFNLDIDWVSCTSACQKAKRYLDSFTNLLLTQHVKFPTRMNSTLDLIFTTKPVISSIERLPPLANADHFIISFHLCSENRHQQDRETFLDFAHCNYEGLSEALEQIDWWKLLGKSTSVNELYNIFSSTMHTIFPNFVPTSVKGGKMIKYPEHIENLMQQRLRLFSNLPCPLENPKYLKVTSKLRKHLNKFLSVREKKLSAKPSLLFSHVRRLMGEYQCTHSLTNTDGSKCYNDLEKAEALAAHFAKVFRKPNVMPEPLQPSSSESTLYLYPWDVQKLLATLKPSTFLPADGLPQIIFQRCAKALALPTSIIINMTLLHGQLPDVWKQGIVTAIPKKPTATNVNEFRPICINPVLCKVTEKVIRTRLENTCKMHSLIPREQYGFIHGSSTTVQLLSCDFLWKKALAERKRTDVIYFDLSKAFDRLNIAKLIEKLEKLGIQYNILTWLSSYLTGRVFSVRFNNVRSKAYTIHSGVPQGGALSPLLFNLYTCDLPILLNADMRVKSAIYADDIKIFSSFSENDAYEVAMALQSSINKLLEWAKENDIDVNLTKTFCLSIGKRFAPIPVDYTHGDTIIPNAETVRDLGIILDEKLDPHVHIKNMTSLALQKLFLIFRNLKFVSAKTFIQLYKSYILPHLEYASQVWNPSRKKDILAIEKVQKTFTRILFYKIFPNSNYPSALPSYQSRLKRLHLKSLYHRHVVADLVLAFRILRLETKLRPSEFWVWKPCSGRKSRFSFHYSLSSFSRKMKRCPYEKSFFVRTASWFEKLPPKIMSSVSGSSFKSKLRNNDVLALLDLDDIS